MSHRDLLSKSRTKCRFGVRLAQTASAVHAQDFLVRRRTGIRNVAFDSEGFAKSDVCVSATNLHLGGKQRTEELGLRSHVSPTIGEIARFPEVSEAKVFEAVEAGNGYRAELLDTRRDAGEVSLEVPVVEEGFDRSLDREELRVVLTRLEPREQMIVTRVFFEGWSQARVGTEIGLSQMQVSTKFGSCHGQTSLMARRLRTRGTRRLVLKDWCG